MRLIEQLTGAEYRLSGVTTIGRSHAATICLGEMLVDDKRNVGMSQLDAMLAQVTASRLHARITVLPVGAQCGMQEGQQEGQQGLALLEDLDSTNGVTVNGLPLPRGQNRVLVDGDVVGVGGFRFLLAEHRPSHQQDTNPSAA